VRTTRSAYEAAALGLAIDSLTRFVPYPTRFVVSLTLARSPQYPSLPPSSNSLVPAIFDGGANHQSQPLPQSHSRWHISLNREHGRGGPSTTFLIH